MKYSGREIFKMIFGIFIIILILLIATVDLSRGSAEVLIVSYALGIILGIIGWVYLDKKGKSSKLQKNDKRMGYFLAMGIVAVGIGRLISKSEILATILKSLVVIFLSALVILFIRWIVSLKNKK